MKLIKASNFSLLRRTWQRGWGAACQVMLICILVTANRISLASEDPDQAFWTMWKSPGVHAIMRHATAPGYGDPDEFRLNDCKTQRNLSDKGRNEARTTGEQFAKHGPMPTAIYASQWCRTTETASLLNLGTVSPLPALNSFFQGRGDGGEQTRALKTFLANQDQDAKLFLVTHQVNISALTGSFSDSGEVLLFTFNDGLVTVVARKKLFN